MFVKKLVEKASSKKQPGGHLDGLKSSDVEPRLVFHYGTPSGAIMFAYDSTQKTLAISTYDGRIKLFGRDNTQALLESPEALPSKFMQFVQNKGILLNVTAKDHIEIWDIEKLLLSHVYVFRDDITSFAVLQHRLYMYVGDSLGNISVLKLDQEPYNITQMKYSIPLHASHGIPSDKSGNIAVSHILPQPTSESKRVLLVFSDGLIVLWEIRGSRSVFTTGGSMLSSQYHETKKVTSACWVCPYGSKVAVGYSNGEIFIWSITVNSNSSIELASDSGNQNTPICKLNLGYKSDKIPIASLKWLYADGKASRLYVMGAPESASTNLLQVILLNEHTETRTVKLGLHLSEGCIHMEIFSSSTEQSKQKQDSLVLLGKSGHAYVYDDVFIEKYLLHSQSRGSPSLPKEVTVKMPFADTSITVAKFITNNSNPSSIGDQDYITVAENVPPLFPLGRRPKDGNHMIPVAFSGFMKVKNLYITGHSDGAIKFWDLSCPIPLPILSLKQQSEEDFSPSGIALTSLHFDINSGLLISGDHNGTVRIFKFKSEPYATETSFLSFQGSSKKGNNIIQSLKLVKLNGAVLCMNMCHSSGHLAVGSEQGYVSIVDIEGPTVLYQKHIVTEFSAGIISLHCETCSQHGFEKNVLVVATKDSSVLALDGETGNMLSTSTVRPKKPSRALFMQILNGQDMLVRGSNMLNSPDPSKGNFVDDQSKQSFILLCSEKAVYVYSLNHVVQGVKKVHYKKKFHSSSCCWAATFCGASDVGLILLFSTGKIEIRSLPELSLIRESAIKGFTYSMPKLNSLSDSSVCCSQDGEIVMVNGDLEMFAVSVLLQKESYRLLDTISQIYTKDPIASEEVPASESIAQKEKKKGIFSSIIKDIQRGKPKQGPEVEKEDTIESFQELSTIFSTANFVCEEENKDSLAMDSDDVDLDIDDIDLEDPGEKPKDRKMLGAFNKQKLASKFQAFKGKIKQMNTKNEKDVDKEEEQDEKAGAVDQIKKKYGFSSSGESSAAKLAESKLQDNLKKLQGINLRATQMQDTARSFSAMAKEVLQIAEKDKKSS